MADRKLLVITYYWPPAGGAGVQRALKFVRYLCKLDVVPIVLTVDEGKASYPVTDPSLCGDIPDGLKVIRTSSSEPLNILSKLMGKKNVPYAGFANTRKDSLVQKALRWIRGNFFIPDARVGWVKYAVKAASEIIRSEGVRTVLISSPPHSSQLVGLKLKKAFPDLYWIADLRDPWVDIYYYRDLLHTAPAARHDAILEKRVITTADQILVVSDQIRRTFCSKLPTQDESKIHVIPNGFDEVDFKGDILSDSGVFTITYVGTMAESYHPSVFFDALNRLAQDHPDASIQFRFVGNVPWNIKKQVEEMDMRVEMKWIDHVPHAQAIQYMRSADLLLLIIPDVQGAEGILTGKLFEYIGSERYILGIGPSQGDAARILQECNAGQMFERTNVDGLYSTLQRKLLSKQQGESLYEGNDNRKKYTRMNLTLELSKLIRS